MHTVEPPGTQPCPTSEPVASTSRHEALIHQGTTHDLAPVIAAQVLLRHGMSEDLVQEYVARTWPLEPDDCHAAIEAARLLLRREQPRPGRR
jgi:hypothetical protein